MCVCVCVWRLFSTHNLQFDGLAIQFDGADLEINSNGADVALCVGVILKMNERTREGQREGGGQSEGN